MIFCNTKNKTENLSEFLQDHKIKARSLSGRLEQRDRQDRLNLLKAGQISVLVTTDVAARGLHVPKVDLVINYDIPTRDEFYVHRIGRTGRDNRQGYSLSLICPEDEERFLRIETKHNLEIKNAKFLETS